MIIRRRGYTLVELIVAMAIFALLITPIASLITSNINNNKKAKESIEYANVINYAFESLMNGQEITNYLGYDIEYEIDRKSSYNLEGIRYFNYDLFLKIKGDKIFFSKEIDIDTNQTGIDKYVFKSPVELELSEKTNLKLEIIKDGNDYRYKFYKEGENSSLSHIIVNNPKASILLILDSNFNREISVLIEGVKDGTTLVQRVINFSYYKTQNDNTTINLASVYPNVVFERRENIEQNNIQQLVKEVTIILNKNGREVKRQTFDLTERIK